MTDEQLNRAVAECAGWEWDAERDMAIERQDDGTEVYRLFDWPMSLDDVVAACEAAGVMWGVNRSSSKMCLGIVVKKDMSGAATRTHPTDPAKALALALIEACGVEVEDD